MSNRRQECTFFWFIENYSYCWHKNGEKLTSPPFTAIGLDGATWNLQLYPRGLIGEDKGSISVVLARSLNDEGPEDVRVKFELSALGADGSPLHSLQREHAFRRETTRGLYGFLKMGEVLLRRKADYLPQAVLTLRCKIWNGEGSVCKVSPVCARTRIGIERITYLHVVEDFSTLEPHQRITTEIPYSSNEDCFVSSRLCFTRDSFHAGEIVVKIKSSESSHILSKLKISLVGCGNKVTLCAKDDNRHDVKRKDIRRQTLSLIRQVIIINKNEYLQEGKLSLLCECVFSTGLEFEKTEECVWQLPVVPAEQTDNKKFSTNVCSNVKNTSYTSALEDMKALYLNGFLTDVELRTKSKSFQAHKIVLCARSAVFSAMLTSDMREKYDNCIQVDDLGDDVVQQLLLFLYSDTVESLDWEMATHLLYAADKYQVGKLKEVCSSFLVENLATNNACELLLLADTHSYLDLKAVVHDFISKHEKLFCSEEWKVLMETNPLLAMKYKRRC